MKGAQKQTEHDEQKHAFNFSEYNRIGEIYNQRNDEVQKREE